MKLTQPQQLICEHLIDESLTVADIAQATNFSPSYIRLQIKQLETYNRIEKVDTRQPYIYKLTDDNPYITLRDRMVKYKILLEVKDAPTDNSFVLLLRQADREDWPAIADELRAIIEVIDQLELDGKLINTLEGLLK